MFYKYVFPQNNLSLTAKIHLVSFGYTELVNEPSMLHSHPFTEIIIPQNEQGILTYSGKRIPLKQNTLYIINPNISHTETNSNEKFHLKYYTVKIKNVIYHNSNKQNELIEINCSNYLELNTYLSTALRYLSSSPIDEDLATLNLSCFYCAFLNALLEQDYLANPYESKNLSSMVQEVEFFLSRNYGSDIKIIDLANQFGISHVSLIQKFKNEMGVTPKEYLMRTRMEAAKYLLSSSDHTITQISSLVGFSSPAYFTFLFKEYTNFTPKEFRVNSKSS